MVNFYRRYISNCAEIIAPMTDLTKSCAPNIVEWGEKEERAFTQIKHSHSQIKHVHSHLHQTMFSTNQSNITGVCATQTNSNSNKLKQICFHDAHIKGILTVMCKVHMHPATKLK